MAMADPIETANAGAKARVLAIIDRYGCLPPLSSECTASLAAFDREALAQVLERMVRQAGVYGYSKITVHMDLADAIALAQELRR
jgi:hypothetical protein